MNFGPDSPFSMCVGGHVGGVKVVNLAETTAIRRHFGSRHQEGAAFGEQLAKAREEESETRLEMGLPEEDDDAFDESDEEEDWSKIMDDLSISHEKKGKKSTKGAKEDSAAALPAAAAKTKKQKKSKKTSKR